MPMYSFEQIIAGATDKLSPGANILMSSFHNGPSGGVSAAKNAIQESLHHRSGKHKIICGVTVLGKDDHVCSK